MPRATVGDTSLTRFYIPKVSQTPDISPSIARFYKPIDDRCIHEGRVVDQLYYTSDHIDRCLSNIHLNCLYKINEPIVPRFILDLHIQVTLQRDDSSVILISFMIQNEFITLSLTIRSSSHQGDDDEDDGASRASTSYLKTYLNSLRPLDYQPYDIPTSSEQNDDLLFERQTDLLNQTQKIHKELRGSFKSFGKALRGVFSKKKKMLEQILENPKLIQTHSISKSFSSNKFPPNAYHHFTIFFIIYQPPQTTMASTRAFIYKASKRLKINIIPPKQLFVDLTQDDTKTPLPKHQLSSPSALNAPSKTPSTIGTSSSSIDYTHKSPTSSTSPPTNGYLNSPTSPPLREMHEVIFFIMDWKVKTRQILDSKGAIPSKNAADAKVAIQEMVEYSQKWHNGTSRTRSTKTFDGLAAIQAQLNNHRREIKKVNERVLQERGFGSLPSSTKANPRDHVKSITTTEDDTNPDVKVPLILKISFLSTAHAKIDVFKRKITLRVEDEKIIFKSMKPASSLIKRVYMLGLREIIKPDLEARLMGENLVLNRSLDPLYGDYILNYPNVSLDLKRNQVDDLMPAIEEGEKIWMATEIKTWEISFWENHSAKLCMWKQEELDNSLWIIPRPLEEEPVPEEPNESDTYWNDHFWK
nr:DNA helicase Pif1-like protein [Tanacetum cinerariifolium]